ncbi:MAG TPA: hypothetical protein VHA78_00635 [Candidatus Peribacteraceae bacterium]|nr:hypothetical protein [Candidatus Peribacteraceae bacterium]
MQRLLTLIVSRPDLGTANRWLRHLAESRIETYGVDVALTTAECNRLLTIPAWEWDATALARALFSPVSIANLRLTARKGGVHQSYLATA